MLVTPNFDEVQDSVDAGEYAVRVVGAEHGEWEKDGRKTPYVNWSMDTFNEQDPKNNGRRVFDRTPIAGKGAFRLQNFYRAATGEALKGPFETEQLIGRELKITVAINDKGYTEVKSYAQL